MLARQRRRAEYSAGMRITGRDRVAISALVTAPLSRFTVPGEEGTVREQVQVE
jgi:hypothetical protein